MNLWDFGGETRFRFLLPQYCSGASLVLLVYDITNWLSFEHLPAWLHIIKKAVINIPIVLIGAKLDLEGFRAVTKEDRLHAQKKKYNLLSSVEVVFPS